MPTCACRCTGLNHHPLRPLTGVWLPAPSCLPFLQEPVVTNLASIYELMGDLASKQRFADWVAAAAPDDFDLAATKTGAGA